MAIISVIMSTYNEPAEWLKASIESVLNQSFTDFEFIIVNDNPTRNELKTILHAYRIKDDRIIIVENNRNLGPAGAKNKAIEIASGKYIAVMDADDISLPQRLQLQCEFLEKYTQIFLVGSAVKIIDQNGRFRAKVVKHTRHEQIRKSLLTGKLAFYHPSIMFRNEEFKYREKFDATLDLDLYLILLSANRKFANLKDVLLHYRMSNQSISGAKRRKQIIFKELALKFYHERQTSSSDSYDSLNFKNESQVLRFLQIDSEQLEVKATKEQIAFILGAGNYQAAKEAYATYRRKSIFTLDKAVLWMFINLPFTHKLYRKIRYEVLGKLVRLFISF